jgi:hypothetical protein
MDYRPELTASRPCDDRASLHRQETAMKTVDTKSARGYEVNPSAEIARH